MLALNSGIFNAGALHIQLFQIELQKELDLGGFFRWHWIGSDSLKISKL